VNATVLLLHEAPASRQPYPFALLPLGCFSARNPGLLDVHFLNPSPSRRNLYRFHLASRDCRRGESGLVSTSCSSCPALLYTTTPTWSLGSCTALLRIHSPAPHTHATLRFTLEPRHSYRSGLTLTNTTKNFFFTPVSISSQQFLSAFFLSICFSDKSSLSPNKLGCNLVWLLNPAVTTR
jgi:hypothetical protein